MGKRPHGTSLFREIVSAKRFTRQSVRDIFYCLNTGNIYQSREPL